MSDPQNLNQSGTLNTGAPPPEVPVLNAPGTNAPQQLQHCSDGGGGGGGSGGGGPTLLSIAITPTTDTVAPGAHVQYTAIGTYSSGPPLNITSAVMWSTSNSGIATFDADGTLGGLLTAITSGSCTVSATALGVTSNAAGLTVVPGEFEIAAPIPVGAGSAVGTLDTMFARPFYIPSDVTALSLKLANRQWNAGIGNTVDCNVALYKSDGTGKPTGASFGTWNGQTVPGDGSFLVLPEVPIVRGTDGQIVIVIAFAANGPPVAQTATTDTYGVFQFNSMIVDPCPLTGSWLGAATIGVLDMRLHYSTARRRFNVFGDSISVGATASFDGCAWNLIGAASDYGVMIEGVFNFGSLANFANPPGNPFLFDQLFFTGADLTIEVGVNDLGSGAATMKANLLAIIADAQARNVRFIYANTIAPPNNAGFNAARVAYNADLLANFASYGITAVADLAAKQVDGGLADNADTTMLYPPFTTDGTHLTDLGQAQVKNAWLPLL